MAATTMSNYESNELVEEVNGLDKESSQFVDRVSHLPMVALTLSRLSEAYQKTKLRNELLKSALEKGEETVLSSWALAAILASKTGLQGPLNVADSSACYLLSKVEEKLPIITYTPDEIIHSTKRIYDDKVRPQIDRLANMKENTVQKYNDAKNFGATKLTDAKHLGASTVKSVLDAPINSLEWSLNTADSLVDKLLPEADSAHHQTNGVHLSGYDGNFDHAKILSAKLRQRLLARVTENVHAANLLAQALQVVETLKHSSAANSINHVLDNLRRLSNAGKERAEENGHSEEADEVSDEGVLKLVKHLSEQLKDTLEVSSQQLTRFLPQPVTERIVQASKIAADIYLQISQASNVNELPHSLLGQVNSYVTSVQVTMNSVLDVLTETYLLKWMIPEYNNIGSLDIHIQ
jgi:phosphohistidine phosphatase SixA